MFLLSVLATPCKWWVHKHLTFILNLLDGDDLSLQFCVPPLQLLQLLLRLGRPHSDHVIRSDASSLQLLQQRHFLLLQPGEKEDGHEWKQTLKDGERERWGCDTWHRDLWVCSAVSTQTRSPVPSLLTWLWLSPASPATSSLPPIERPLLWPGSRTNQTSDRCFITVKVFGRSDLSVVVFERVGFRSFVQVRLQFSDFLLQILEGLAFSFDFRLRQKQFIYDKSSFCNN